MMDLQRSPEDVTDHRYGVTELISTKIIRLFPLFVRICSKMSNHQRPVFFCNQLILLFEFTLQCFMSDIHIVWKSS